MIIFKRKIINNKLNGALTELKNGRIYIYQLTSAEYTIDNFVAHLVENFSIQGGDVVSFETLYSFKYAPVITDWKGSNVSTWLLQSTITLRYINSYYYSISIEGSDIGPTGSFTQQSATYIVDSSNKKWINHTIA